MSFKTVSYLYCDGSECQLGEPFRHAPVEHGFVGATITEQRHDAKRVAGWTHKNGSDYCDECSAKLASTDSKNAA